MSCTLKEVKNKSAPGDDGISYKAIKIFNKAYPDILHRLYSACLQFGVLSEAWKPGRRKDPLQEGANWPITLQSTLGKVLERCIAWHLLYRIQQGDVISNRQFGFLPGRSIKDNV